jgi:hypothetical protein
MTITILSLLVCPLLAAPQPKAIHAAGQVAPQVMPGSYRNADPESPDVVEARDAIQSRLAQLTIEKVNAAYVQVVAGTNYKLVCDVQDTTGPTVWQFVVWHRLNGEWDLTSAEKLSSR